MLTPSSIFLTISTMLLLFNVFVYTENHYCPKDWVYFNKTNSCYQIVSVNTNTACVQRSDCQARLGELDTTPNVTNGGGGFQLNVDFALVLAENHEFICNLISESRNGSDNAAGNHKYRIRTQRLTGSLHNDDNDITGKASSASNDSTYSYIGYPDCTWTDSHSDEILTLAICEITDVNHCTSRNTSCSENGTVCEITSPGRYECFKHNDKPDVAKGERKYNGNNKGRARQRKTGEESAILTKVLPAVSTVVILVFIVWRMSKSSQPPDESDGDEDPDLESVDEFEEITISEDGEDNFGNVDSSKKTRIRVLRSSRASRTSRVSRVSKLSRDSGNTHNAPHPSPLKEAVQGPVPNEAGGAGIDIQAVNQNWENSILNEKKEKDENSVIFL